MKLKKRNQNKRNQSKTYKIVVPYSTDSTTQSYNTITWSK